ncbi:uncharacterized protein DS421_18g614800 [Arachis hypogaea]|nr:uncharacterized protein DS421_18g614800 [Arachis hypogaea]
MATKSNSNIAMLFTFSGNYYCRQNPFYRQFIWPLKIILKLCYSLLVAITIAAKILKLF